MRHIKKFNESILDEDISYQEVSNQTWNDKYMFGDLKRFSKNELDKFIKSISEEWDVELYHGNCICLTYKDFQEMEYSIFEDDDEYFWVCLTQGSYEPRSWKCDTWEGLVKLLKDNNLLSYNESFKTEEYYTDLSENDFYSQLKTIINIPENDIKELKSYIDGLGDMKDKSELSIETEPIPIRDTSGFLRGHHAERINYAYLGFYLKSNFERFNIYAIPDEYYQVNYWTNNHTLNDETIYEFYKCDQIEGVIELIKDKLNQ